MRPTSILLFFICLVFAISSYANTDIHKKEATALCNVYKPDNWKEFLTTHQPEEVYKELGNRISKTVITNEFRNIFKNYLDNNATDFHSTVTKQVSKLIGEKWECKYFDDFYKPQVQRKEIQLELKNISIVKTVNHGKEVIISVDSRGNFYVNDNALKNNNRNTLISAIKLTTSENKPKLVIRSDANAPHNTFITILDAAHSLGITNISIETY